MLSETQARDLLHAAADTVEVGPAAPIDTRHPQRLWPLLAAAAAVVTIVASTAIVVGRGSDSPPPADLPDPRPTLAANQIPPVMGLDLVPAEILLEERGLEVEVAYEEDCVPNHVVAGTTPPVGTRFQRGDVVRVRVLYPTEAFCDVGGPGRGWEMLRFALGVAPPPLFADQVTLYGGMAEPVELSAEEAADPEKWEVCDGDTCASALSLLSTAATSPSKMGGVPKLTVHQFDTNGGDPAPCSNGPSPVSGLTAVAISIQEPMDFIPLCAVTAYYSETGELEAVAVPLLPHAEPQPEPSAEAAAAADAFVAWARGSSALPPFTEGVRFLLNNGVIRTLDPEGTARPASWRVCYSGIALPCVSPIETLGEYDGPVVQSPTPATNCVQRSGSLPSDLADDELIRLDQPEARSCRDAFAVELWVDDRGQITAVNMLPGRPAPQ